MPAAVASDVRPTVERDDLDDIFNYDAGIDATFNQSRQDWTAQDDANNNDTNRQPHDVPENIDEEVKVTKKRTPTHSDPTTKPSTAFYPNKASQNFERLPRTAS
jgi:replication fork protection complex subunit Csm3/Swi3